MQTGESGDPAVFDSQRESSVLVCTPRHLADLIHGPVITQEALFESIKHVILDEVRPLPVRLEVWRLVTVLTVRIIGGHAVARLLSQGCGEIVGRIQGHSQTFHQRGEIEGTPFLPSCVHLEAMLICCLLWTRTLGSREGRSICSRRGYTAFGGHPVRAQLCAPTLPQSEFSMFLRSCA